jgi:hypothetical protein
MAAPTKDNLVVAATLVTLTELPVEGGIIMLTLDGVPQVEDVDYTVDELTGIITITGASDGQKVAVVYVAA